VAIGFHMLGKDVRCYARDRSCGDLVCITPTP